MLGYRSGLTEQELNAVLVIKIPIAEAVVKQRKGHAQDKEGDLKYKTWSGVVPVCYQVGSPEADQYSNDSNAPAITL